MIATNNITTTATNKTIFVDVTSLAWSPVLYNLQGNFLNINTWRIIGNNDPREVIMLKGKAINIRKCSRYMISKWKDNFFDHYISNNLPKYECEVSSETSIIYYNTIILMLD